MNPHASWLDRLFCRLGWHDWYHGVFVRPVWGRIERRCIWCRRSEYYQDGKYHQYAPQVGQ